MLISVKQQRIRLLQTAIGLVLAFAAQNAHAGAFQLHEQSTTYLGTAYSGTASTAEDCSTGFYNPAGLTELKHNQALISGIFYWGHIKLNDAAGTSEAGNVASGGPTVRPSSNMFIPSFHVSAKINRRWSVGLGVVSPFGLITKYPSDSVARYVATLTKLETYDITPSVAYKITNKFSLGAGLDALQFRATVNESVAAGLGEGYVNMKGDSSAFGYHVGILYKPTSKTKMGLVYFSGFDTTIANDIYTLHYIPIVTFFKCRVHLPDRAVFSMTHNFSKRWSAATDIEFVHWSRLKDFTFVQDRGFITKTYLNNKNAWRIALGGNYNPCDAWKIKAGLAWDQSPVTDQNRTARFPDSDRFWLALGVKHKCGKSLSLDVAYAHLFMKKCPINEHDWRADAGVTGNYRNSADQIGVQLTWSFV